MKERTKILIVDDEESIRFGFGSYLESHGYHYLEAANGAQAMSLIRSESPAVVILDMKLPDIDGLDLLMEIRKESEFITVIMISAFGTIERAVRALKLGAENFVAKPCDPQALLIVIEHCLEIHNLRKEALLKELNKKTEDQDLFIGAGEKMLKFYQLAKIVSNDMITVLIQGETGTGKGKWAQWIHKNSDRASKPFVELNCSGLSKELLESELFGYDQGAFTGAAKNKVGLLEIANGGTLFLDEISEMELAVQAKVLKVLEEKRFRRLGSVQERFSDARLITAANRNLQDLVKSGSFREDLYYRLNSMPLYLPPLRERKEDILPLAEFFIEQLARQRAITKPVLTPEAKGLLKNYPWPGNLRELRNILERAVLLSQGNQIGVEFLPMERTVLAATKEFGESLDSLEQVEARYMRYVLASVKGNYSKAAEILKVNRNTIYNKLRTKTPES